MAVAKAVTISAMDLAQMTEREVMERLIDKGFPIDPVTLEVTRGHTEQSYDPMRQCTVFTWSPSHLSIPEGWG